MKPYRVGETVRVIAVDERRTIEEVRTGKIRHTGEIRHYITRSDSVHHHEAPADAVLCERTMPGPYRIANVSKTEAPGRVRMDLRSTVSAAATCAWATVDKIDPDHHEPTNPHEERARGTLVAEMLLMIEDSWSRNHGRTPALEDVENLTNEQWRLIRAMCRPGSPDKIPSKTTQKMAIDAFRNRALAQDEIRKHGANAFAQMCSEQQAGSGVDQSCATCGEVHTVEERAAVGGGCPR